MLLVGLAANAAAASTHTVSGRLLGVPRGASSTVEAVAIRHGTVVAAAVLSRGSYSLRVPAGATFILARVVDIRQHRQLAAYTARNVTRSLSRVNLRLRAPAAGDEAARVAAAGGGGAGAASSTVTVSTIPIFGPDGKLPGGAEAGFIAGAFPVCQAHGGHLLDGSTTFLVSRRREIQLAEQGQLDFNLLPWQQPVSDYGVNGSVRVGPGGGPLADIDFVNAGTGKIVHFVVSGDPADWDNIGRFMSRLGDHIIQNSVDEQIGCGQKQEPPPRRPPPKLHCAAGKGEACVTFSGQSTGEKSTPRTVATGGHDDVSWDIKWSPPASGNGEWDTIDAGSQASGSGDITFFPGHTPPSCNTGFALSPTFPPTLVEETRGDQLTIRVPNPIEASIGTGAGYPSIVPTNSSCPALISAMPANFSITVPIRHGTTTQNVQGGGPLSFPYGGTGSSTLKGTITVQIG